MENSYEIEILDREMTDQEFKRMKAGFDENSIDNQVEVQTADRYSKTAVLKGEFVGCVSGLAYKNDQEYSGWFYLTDLFVEKPYRFSGLGGALLTGLEEKITQIGVKNIWVWTAGYEAPAFYKKHGYKVFEEMEDWYSDGSSRVGLKKRLG